MQPSPKTLLTLACVAAAGAAAPVAQPVANPADTAALPSSEGVAAEALAKRECADPSIPCDPVGWLPLPEKPEGPKYNPLPPEVKSIGGLPPKQERRDVDAVTISDTEAPIAEADLNKRECADPSIPCDPVEWLPLPKKPEGPKYNPLPPEVKSIGGLPPRDVTENAAAMEESQLSKRDAIKSTDIGGTEGA